MASVPYTSVVAIPVNTKRKGDFYYPCIYFFKVLKDYYFTIKEIMIILPLVGIALCVFGYSLANSARTAWAKWLEELGKIEKELKNEAKFVFPSEARKEIKNGCFCSGEWPWRISCFCLPLIFLVLWIASLCCSLYISVCYVFFAD